MNSRILVTLRGPDGSTYLGMAAEESLVIGGSPGWTSTGTGPFLGDTGRKRGTSTPKEGGFGVSSDRATGLTADGRETRSGYPWKKNNKIATTAM